MTSSDVASRLTPTFDPIFFVHVMKTGGTTVRHHIRKQYEEHELYPSRTLDADLHTANERIDYLCSLAPERRAVIRAYMGHFPYMVVRRVPTPLSTLTVLREPVSRVVSHLRHLQRHSPMHRDASLEAIYDDPFLGPSLVRNHEVKIFSLTDADEPISYRHVLEIDDDRLELAKSNLDEVQTVGVMEHIEVFLTAVERRFGWDIDKSVVRRMTRAEGDVSRSLRDRIARDHEAARDFYAHAVRRTRRDG